MARRGFWRRGWSPACVWKCSCENRGIRGPAVLRSAHAVGTGTVGVEPVSDRDLRAGGPLRVGGAAAPGLAAFGATRRGGALAMGASRIGNHLLARRHPGCGIRLVYVLSGLRGGLQHPGRSGSAALVPASGGGFWNARRLACLTSATHFRRQGFLDLSERLSGRRTGALRQPQPVCGLGGIAV